MSACAAATVLVSIFDSKTAMWKHDLMLSAVHSLIPFGAAQGLAAWRRHLRAARVYTMSTQNMHLHRRQLKVLAGDRRKGRRPLDVWRADHLRAARRVGDRGRGAAADAGLWLCLRQHRLCQWRLFSNSKETWLPLVHQHERSIPFLLTKPGMQQQVFVVCSLIGLLC